MNDLKSQCQVCDATTQTYLCNRCTGELRRLLKGLAGNSRHPGLLTNLDETASGQTRLGELGRHSRSAEVPLRFNTRASDLLTYANSILVEWMRDLCETRGVDVPVLRSTVDVARWLATNVTAIACDQGAGLCFKEIKELTADIEKMIDRPAGRKFCGPCPSVVDAHGKHCSTALLAARTANEVECPVCNTVHNVEEVMSRLMHDLDDWNFTHQELFGVVLPALNERVARSTFFKWVSAGRLHVTGIRDNQSTYRLGDVRRLRADKPQKSQTGAAARKAS